MIDGRGAYRASLGKTGSQTWRSELELDNEPWTTYWEKDDFDGLDMWGQWITSACTNKRCTGRYQDTTLQERTRSTTNELEEHSQQRPWQKMRVSWEEAEVAALDRHGWRRSVIQCVHVDAGWIKVKVQKKSRMVAQTENRYNEEVRSGKPVPVKSRGKPPVGVVGEMFPKRICCTSFHLK